MRASLPRSASYRQLALVIVCVVPVCFVYWNMTRCSSNAGDMPGVTAASQQSLQAADSRDVWVSNSRDSSSRGRKKKKKGADKRPSGFVPEVKLASSKRKTNRPRLGVEAVSDRVEVFYSDEDHDDFCTFYQTLNKEVPAPKICTYDPQHDSISRRVHEKHIPWDAKLVTEILDFMKKLDQGGTGQEGGVSLVDIGCQIGGFTVMAAASGFEVLAVDILDLNFQLMGTSLRRNNVTSLVTMVHNAVSDKHEKLTVQMVDGRMGRTYIRPYEGPDGQQSSDPTQSVVKAIVLDDLIPYVRTPRVVMKMDVEASEGRAMRVADRFFKEVDVICVLMEWVHVKKIDTDRDYIIHFFTRHGYRAFSSLTSQVLSPASNMTWPHDVFWLKRYPRV